ncbi:MAG: ATP-dependent DNA helicase RecQ [Bacteroidota bacterium]
MIEPVNILQNIWGYPAFRPGQEEIIQSVLAGNDTVALLPTGGGKSLCFQIPALVQEGICLVISPLVALINDQVKSLKEKGVKALALTGGISFAELNTLLDNAVYGNYKFLYLSPERLQQESVQNAIKRMDISLIAIDEAHCISQWGHDFRPAYQNIHCLSDLHPKVPTIALTATATKKVLQDTIKQLRLSHPQIFKNSFLRANLSYQVKEESDKLYRIEQILRSRTGNAIIYVRSRSKAEEVSGHLNHKGIASSFFHGGISSEEKKNRLDAWKSEIIPTMVATNAFGMGIDHGNVRSVIHIQLPESLESYFQEAGRAGRDGAPALAIILYGPNDKQLAQKQFVEAIPSVKDIKRLYRILQNYFQISYGEGEFTNHSFSFTDFCTSYQLNTLMAYNGLTMLDRLGVIQLSKEFGRRSILKFLVPSQALLKEFEKNVSFSVVGRTILRMYGGIFETANAIDLKLVANKMGMPVDQVVSVLKEMEQRELIELKLHTTDASITFLLPREDDKTINPLQRDIKALKDRKEEQLTAVIDYIDDTSSCKQIYLTNYFGEEKNQSCGICSFCVSKNVSHTKNEMGDISMSILSLINETPLDSRTIIEKLTFEESEILTVIHLLLDAGKIHLNAVNQYFVK